MIQIIALGNLGADAEVKTINEKNYISFRVASTEKRNDQDETTWVSVLASENPKLLPYLKKGQQVFVQGRMKVGIYQTQQSVGVDVSVFASTLQLCGSKKEESASSNQAPYGSTVAPTATGNPVPTHETVAQQPAVAPFPPPFPPAVDENGNEKPDDLPFDYRGAAV